ncbi:MAG: hypothetical protein H6873_13915 [Hyphomicrobiaceae bacterium]|nr:hypothetical protein [Hyphomicrobiaceae bacterium]
MLLQKDIMNVRRERSHSLALDPPYQLTDIDMIYIMCRFKPEAVARIFPPGLKPNKSCWGPISVYQVNSGWGIAPYSAFFMALEVEGYDSPDGSPAMYMHSGLYSDLGGKVMTERYNSNFRLGHARQGREGDRAWGEGYFGDQLVARFDADVTREEATHLMGIHRYIGRNPEGEGFNVWAISYEADFIPIAPRSVEFLPGAEKLVHLIEPEEFVWPSLVRNLTMTIPAPQRLGAENDNHSRDVEGLGLIEMFARMGRGAAIVDPFGRLVRMNSAASQLVESGRLQVAHGQLKSVRQEEGKSLDLIIQHAAMAPGAVSEQISLRSADGERFIIAQAMALDDTVSGSGKLIVFLDDPSADIRRNAMEPLRLLGLTEAEAKIAALVGAGRSPAEAAGDLELSVNTVRSALKLIFDKLGIGRQAELAKIVTRLESRAIA